MTKKADSCESPRNDGKCLDCFGQSPRNDEVDLPKVDCFDSCKRPNLAMTNRHTPSLRENERSKFSWQSIFFVFWIASGKALAMTKQGVDCFGDSNESPRNDKAMRWLIAFGFVILLQNHLEVFCGFCNPHYEKQYLEAKSISRQNAIFLP